jgi:hypothetical protein
MREHLATTISEEVANFSRTNAGIRVGQMVWKPPLDFLSWRRLKDIPSNPSAPANPPRLMSLDAFRGATIAGMMMANNAGDWSHVYPPLEHAAWHGWTYTDTTFPHGAAPIVVAHRDWNFPQWIQQSLQCRHGFEGIQLLG